MGWEFYVEQHHSYVAWNEREQLSELQLLIHQSKKTKKKQTNKQKKQQITPPSNNKKQKNPAKAQCSPVQPMIVTEPQKMIRHYLDLATITTCLSSFALQRWHFKTWKVLLQHPVCASIYIYSCFQHNFPNVILLQFCKL